MIINKMKRTTINANPPPYAAPPDIYFYLLFHLLRYTIHAVFISFRHLAYFMGKVPRPFRHFFNAPSFNFCSGSNLCYSKGCGQIAHKNLLFRRDTA